MIFEEWEQQVLEAVQQFKKAENCDPKVTIFVEVGLFQQALSELLKPEVANEGAHEMFKATLLGYPVIITLPDNRCQFKIVVDKT